MATVGAVGAGVMASCHVASPLGTYIVWTMVGGAGPMMGFSEAFGWIIAAGVLAGLSVPIAGMLAETPWLLLPFIGIAMTLMTYFVTLRRFGSPSLVLKVIMLDTFYNVVFHPNDFAVMSASTFGGAVLAFGTIAVFDTWLWPDPAEAMLLESLSESLMRTRKRLLDLAGAYLDPQPGHIPPLPPPMSAMQHQLELLSRVTSEGATAFRHAVLLAAVSRTERLHGEVDRLTIVVREGSPGYMRETLHDQLWATVSVIAAAIEEMASEIPREIPIGPDLPPPPAGTRVKPAIEALEAATVAARPTFIARASADEVVNAAAFITSLKQLADLTGRRLDMPPESARESHERRWYQLAPFDQSMARYSMKLGLATVVGYVIGVTSQHENLSVILTTILIAGLPTYGASLHKMILRLCGNSVGGAFTILATILITPNFETLPVYMMTCAIVFLISGYIGLSSGRIAYAGKQIGTAFTLSFIGLGPIEAIDSPLYRVWGILIGVMVVTVVFFTIWPEYSSDSMLPRLRKALRGTLNLVPGSPAAASVPQIDATTDEITHALFELLEVVDDARLEGARSRIDQKSVVDACGALRRIAHRLGRVDAERIAHPLPPLPDESMSLYAQFLAATHDRLAGWLDFFSGAKALDSRHAAAIEAAYPPDKMAGPLHELNERITANTFAEVSSWTTDQRGFLFAELQSFHRIVELSAELDSYLAKVPRFPL
jgi:uncharacterized membrane protein YccC